MERTPRGDARCASAPAERKQRGGSGGGGGIPSTPKAFAPSSAAAAPASALSEQQQQPQQPVFCRICLDSDTEGLIAPCQCRGTQQYVHVQCLRKWQSVAGKRDGDERAYRCSVCRTPFTLQPPRRRGRALARALLQGPFARGIAAAACVAVLALGAAGGPPWPHLALAALLLLGTRSHAALAGGALIAAVSLGTMHSRGMRLSFQPDATGRVSLSFIRHGRPVPGLGPGSLLAASPDLDRAGGVFARAVVLVTEHGGRRGTRGVILSRPLGDLDDGSDGGDEDGRQGGGALSFFGVGGSGGSKRPSPGATLRHFLGGPVGMPGDSPRPEVAVLHGVPDVPGARRLLPRGLTKKGKGALGGGDADAPPDPRSLLFEGGGLVDVVRAAARSAERSLPAGARKGGRVAEDDDEADSAAAAAAAARASSVAAALAASAARTTVPPFVASSSYPPELPARKKSSVPAKGGGRGATAAAPSWRSRLSTLETVDPAAVPPRLEAEGGRRKKSSPAKGGGGNDDGGDDGLFARIAKRRKFFSSSSSSAPHNHLHHLRPSKPRTVVHVYHGAAAWAAGQLEGELRAGAWGLLPAATAADVLDGSPEELWRKLVSSGRLTWLPRR